MIFETRLDSFSQEWNLSESLKRYTAMSIAVNGHFGHVILGYETRSYAKLTVRRSSDIQLSDRLLSQLFGRS